MYSNSYKKNHLKMKWYHKMNDFQVSNLSEWFPKGLLLFWEIFYFFFNSNLTRPAFKTDEAGSAAFD